MSGKLTVGSLRGLPQMGGQTGGPRRGSAPRPAAARAARDPLRVVQGGTELPPSRRGQRCCRTGCAGCPVGEAIRRARAQAGTTG